MMTTPDSFRNSGALVSTGSWRSKPTSYTRIMAMTNRVPSRPVSRSSAGGSRKRRIVMAEACWEQRHECEQGAGASSGPQATLVKSPSRVTARVRPHRPPSTADRTLFVSTCQGEVRLVGPEWRANRELRYQTVVLQGFILKKCPCGL